MRYLYVLLISVLLWFVQVYSQYRVPLDTAMRYTGIKEATGKNDGYHIEKFQRSVKAPKGSSWCAAFVSYSLTAGKATYPKQRSASSRAFKLKSSIDAKKVYYGIVTIPAGALVGFEDVGKYTGHIEFVREQWRGRTGKTIGGNTSSGNSGSQSDGQGVYQRTRNISLTSNFRITWFTLVNR